MFKLLLDEHISPVVAKGIRTRRPDLSVHALAEWESGRLLGKPDAICLEVALAHGFTFVTYDVRTIPALLNKWQAQGRSHAGVIFVARKTVSSSDFGSLIRSLIALAEERGEEEWLNRRAFLIG